MFVCPISTTLLKREILDSHSLQRYIWLILEIVTKITLHFYVFCHCSNIPICICTFEKSEIAWNYSFLVKVSNFNPPNPVRVEKVPTYFAPYNLTRPNLYIFTLTKRDKSVLEFSCQNRNSTFQTEKMQLWKYAGKIVSLRKMVNPIILFVKMNPLYGGFALKIVCNSDEVTYNSRYNNNS